MLLRFFRLTLYLYKAQPGPYTLRSTLIGSQFIKEPYLVENASIEVLILIAFASYCNNIHHMAK